MSTETASIRPNKEQFVDLMDAPDDEPVVMLNLLKFKDTTDGGDTGPVVMLNLLKFKARAEGESGSGADAYKRYGEAAVKMVEEQGGRVLWQGRADQILIGDPEQGWDSVVLVEYPSRKAFIDMVTAPDYEKAHEHRESGLERTVLIACTERVNRLAGI